MHGSQVVAAVVAKQAGSRLSIHGYQLKDIRPLSPIIRLSNRQSTTAASDNPIMRV